MSTNVQTTEPTRETKRADQLEPGEYIAAHELSEPGPCRVLAAHAFNSGRSRLVDIMYVRPDGRPDHFGDVAADTELELATQAEIDGIGDAKRRAEFVADLRAFADWFEARPWLPVPYSRRAQAKFVNDDDAVKLTEARDMAAEFGVTPEIEDDHVAVKTWIGSFEYVVYDARPKSVPADPTGLDFSREPEDPTPGTVPDGVEGGPVTGRASVPDVQSGGRVCLAIVDPHSGVNCHEPIWWNRAASAWWHQDADRHFNHTATGPSVPPTT